MELVAVAEMVWRERKVRGRPARGAERVPRRWHAVNLSEPPGPLNVALCGYRYEGDLPRIEWNPVAVNRCHKCAQALNALNGDSDADELSCGPQ